MTTKCKWNPNKKRHDWFCRSGEGWLSFAACSAEQIADETCPGYYLDFAGSGVVHLLGAGCSIMGCYFMGARRGRFSKKGEPIDMPGHSVPLAGLGGFILIFGFLAFNGGSQTTISNPGDGGVVALAIVNTILGASTGGITVLFINKLLFKQPWSFLMTLNGALAGMVALCAGCNLYEPWAALLVGALGGFGFMLIHHMMLKLKLDDPLDAVAVHGAGGLVGLLSVPWFMYVGLDVGERGIFWDGDFAHPWLVLAHQLAGALAISAWAVVWSSCIFGGLRYFRILRVSAADEEDGMDVIKHGESAYPADAWLEYQYARNKGDKEMFPANMSSPPSLTEMTTDSNSTDITEEDASDNKGFEDA